MNYSVLLEEALEERGNAVMTFVRPGDGEDATIQTANHCFARMVGFQTHLLTGLRLGALQGVVEQAADWDALMAAVRACATVDLDIRLRVGGRESWLGCGLTFKTDIRENATYGVLIGRDITQARRRAFKDDESQRLLASVFLRTSAPVAIIRSNGAILMANPAFQHTLGYGPDEIVTVNVDTLTPAEYTQVAKQRRARQMSDGGAFELDMETVTKGGAHVPVRLTSVLLRDTQDLRIVTLLPFLSMPDLLKPGLPKAAPDLLPHPAAPAARVPAAPHGPSPHGPAPHGPSPHGPSPHGPAPHGPAPHGPSPHGPAPHGPAPHVPARSVGQVQAISLAAFKAAVGDSWQRLASRAMMLAEQIIKRRLAAADVFNRSGPHGFVIWFDSKDEDRNAAVLAKAAREIRLCFLAEFGEEAAAHVKAAVVSVDREASDGQTSDGQTSEGQTNGGQPNENRTNEGQANRSASQELPPALLDRLRDKQRQATREVQEMLREMRAAPAAGVWVVTDRNRRRMPIVVADFEPALRRRAADPALSFCDEPNGAAEIDLLRIDLAVRELTGGRGGRVLVPVGWPVLYQPSQRRLLDQRLARCGAATLSRLMLAVSGVPAPVTAERWSSVVSPLRRQLGEVALMIALDDAAAASAQEVAVATFPLTLLVIDDARAPAADLYYGLITAARRRDVPVLAWVGAPDHVRDWQELGATMFAATEFAGAA